jgi:putative MATE family efflux protein
MFSNRALFGLLLPLIVEQIFTALMGTADTMMVARLGDAAVSGVSLVDSVNNLMLMVFTATATGGTIACAQYLGGQDREGANRTARQVLLCVVVIALVCCVGCVAFRRPLLGAVFGNVEESVMDAGLTYFLITALSYPFIGAYDASAALYRAAGNSRLPMIVSAIGNVLNVLGNLLFLFVFRWGVLGAGLSTTLSRVFQCVVLLYFHRRPGQIIVLRDYHKIRPELPIIRTILRVGIPTGVENGMFQLGKLMVQSTVATLPTAEIAAQAVINTLEYFTSMPSMAVGLGLVTVAGQCMGAGKPQEAKHYSIKLTIISECLVLGLGVIILLAADTVCRVSGLSAEGTAIVSRMLLIISIVKPVVWPMAFTLPNGMRAAGDVNFSMAVSAGSMWVFRVVLCVVLIRFCGFGVLGVWIAMFVDWADRSIWYCGRFVSGKWMEKHVLETQ